MKRTIIAGLVAAAGLAGCGGATGEANDALANNVTEAANLTLDDPASVAAPVGNAANSAEPVVSNGAAPPPPAAIAPARVEREKGRAIAAPPPQRPPEPSTEVPAPSDSTCAPEHRAAGHC